MLGRWDAHVGADLKLSFHVSMLNLIMFGGRVERLFHKADRKTDTGMPEATRWPRMVILGAALLGYKEDECDRLGAQA